MPTARVAELVAELAGERGREATFMEVCGKHTMAIARDGSDQIPSTKGVL